MIVRTHVLYERDSAVIVTGEHFATADDMLIETVLGSCIAVCLRDPLLKVGGMNHFLLPDGGSKGDRSGRYGVHAMELLMNAIMALGGSRFRMEAKVFGGGNIRGAGGGNFKVGDQNTAFVMNFLEVEGIPVVSRDVGGDSGRRIVFFAREGNVKLRRLNRNESISVEGEDQRLGQRAFRKPQMAKQDVTLF